MATGFSHSQVLRTKRGEERKKALAEKPPLNPPFPYAVPAGKLPPVK